MTGLFVIAFLMMASFSAFATKGSEGGNGGSVVIDGKTYQIADLHFVPQEFGQYQFDPELKAKLKSFHDLLYKHFFGTQVALQQDGASIELFDREIFNPLVEYRLVSKLPSDCSFIPQENLPLVKSTVAVACTKGKLTFILPDYFSKLDLQQKALLIVHERMHALFPSEPYELKVDVIKALYVLTGRYQAALDAGDTSFRFTDEEYDTVRILPYRLNQLYGVERFKWNISREGGVATKIQGDDIHLDITSQVTGAIEGQNITVEGSQVTGSIQGQSIWIDGSQINGGILGGQDIRIQSSQIMGNFTDVSDILLTSVFASISLTGSNHVTMKNVKASTIWLKHVSQCRIENVDLGYDDTIYYYGDPEQLLSISDSSDVVLTNLKRELTPTGYPRGKFDLSIQGAQIQISDTLFDGGASSPFTLADCYDRVIASYYNFKGNDLVAKNSRFIFAPLTGPSCSRNTVNEIGGSAIHLDRVDLGGAHIEGNQITLDGVKLGAARNSAQTQLKGSQVCLDSSVNFAPESNLTFENVRLEKLSIQGMSWNYSTLKNVQISDVHLISTHADTTLTILNGTQIKNIREFTIVRQSLTFGDEKGNAVIDGKGLRYQVGMGGFWDRNTMQVKSQEDLAEWAQQ